jgi:hypothetical protein
LAVVVILGVAAVAWMILGGSIDARTSSSDRQLRERVGSLWGEPQTQRAPRFEARSGSGTADVPLAGSAVRADLKLDQRRKGLLWYATYGVAFNGEYRVHNSAAATRQVTMTWPLPVPGADYDGFVVKADGREVTPSFGDNAATASFPIAAGATTTVEVAYRTEGLDRWSYVPAASGSTAVRDFSLAMTTDFAAVDFPDGAVSPIAKERTTNGWKLLWRYDSLVSGRPIALDMPKPLNPGPVAARISVFAPVSLLFFFASLVLLTATRSVRLHPMNYAFLAAGFFAFHLLFAYLVDRVDINVAFFASAVTSVALCVGYLWLAIGRSPALAEAAIGQFVFLVLFSYSFFFEGITGLTITIGAILTLGYFMVRTAKVDWEEAFRRQPRTSGVPIGFEQA